MITIDHHKPRATGQLAPLQNWRRDLCGEQHGKDPARCKHCFVTSGTIRALVRELPDDFGQSQRYTQRINLPRASPAVPFPFTHAEEHRVFAGWSEKD